MVARLIDHARLSQNATLTPATLLRNPATMGGRAMSTKSAALRMWPGQLDERGNPGLGILLTLGFSIACWAMIGASLV
jgi:hypothetical protein